MNDGAERNLSRGTRLGSGPSAALAEAAGGFELEGMQWLHRFMNLADIAHVRELERNGLCSGDVAAELLSGLSWLATVDEDSLAWDPGVGDIYDNRTLFLRDRIGSAVDHLHAGRARREATTTAWHLSCRRELLGLAEGLLDLVEALGVVARNEATTFMPDFTYLQHAQPTTLAHYLLTFAGPLQRDLDRVLGAFGSIDRSPAGAGSVNGTALPLDRHRLADDLGFPDLVVHTRDAMWMPDVAFELATVCASPLVTAGRLADELIIWSTAEFGYFEASDEHARNSVIMPQKKNPYGLAYVRGASRAALGSVTGAAATQFSPTGQPDNRLLSYFDNPARLRRSGNALALLAEILLRGNFDRTRLGDAAMKGFTNATDICDMLTAEQGIANRVAHRIVGRAVRQAVEQGRDMIVESDLHDAAAALEVELAPLASPELLGDAAGLLQRRTSVGGAAPDSVSQMLESLDETVARHRSWTSDGRHRDDQTEASLLAHAGAHT